MEELLIKNNFLEKENIQLKKELDETREHLKRYTAPERSKKYYESHQDKKHIMRIIRKNY